MYRKQGSGEHGWETHMNMSEALRRNNDTQGLKQTNHSMIELKTAENDHDTEGR